MKKVKLVSFKQTGGNVSDFFGVPTPAINKINPNLAIALEGLGVKTKIEVSRPLEMLFDDGAGWTTPTAIQQAVSFLDAQSDNEVPENYPAEFGGILKAAGFKLGQPGNGYHDLKDFTTPSPDGRQFQHPVKKFSRAAALVFGYYNGLISQEAIDRLCSLQRVVVHE